MKRSYIYILAGFGLLLAACTKDKGNYSYHNVVEPVVTNLDTAYKATVGDTLVVSPTVTIADKTHKLGFEYRITVPEQLKALYFEGQQLRMFFDLNAQRYTAQLTVIDSTNGMKYVYPFAIKGGTIYSNGTLILSQESGVSQLSFVSPDGTMQPRIYSQINGQDLPPYAQQLIPMYDVNINFGTYFGYWIICSGGSNPGMEIDPNSLTKMKTLSDNFFSPPATLNPGQFMGNSMGTLQGVLNGNLWLGTSQTAYFSSTYGGFGLPATDNSSSTYAIFHQAVMPVGPPYALGYDSVKQAVVGFTNYGSYAYIGTTYTQTADTIFDLRNVGLKMLDFEQLQGNNVYMFGSNVHDSVFEAQFTPAFLGYIQVTPNYIRPFVRQDLIDANTKWAGSDQLVFFFTHGSTIYEYIPINQTVIALPTDLGGKTVTMFKMQDANTLLVGIDGSVLYVGVGTNQNGTILNRIDNIPGSPVDIYTRSN